MGVDFVGRLQVVFRGQRRHLQAEAACGQGLFGVFLTPEHVQLIEPLGADIQVRLEADVALGFEVSFAEPERSPRSRKACSLTREARFGKAFRSFRQVFAEKENSPRRAAKTRFLWN